MHTGSKGLKVRSFKVSQGQTLQERLEGILLTCERVNSSIRVTRNVYINSHIFLRNLFSNHSSKNTLPPQQEYTCLHNKNQNACEKPPHRRRPRSRHRSYGQSRGEALGAGVLLPRKLQRDSGGGLPSSRGKLLPTDRFSGFRTA